MESVPQAQIKLSIISQKGDKGQIDLSVSFSSIMNFIQQLNWYLSPVTFQIYQMHESHTEYICNVRTYENSPRSKYIIVSVLNQDATHERAPLSKLRWFNILFSDEVQVKINGIKQFDLFRSQKDDNVSNEKILVATHRDYEKTVYSNTKGWPLQVTLLHYIKKKSQLQFPDTLTLHQAIDTYRCIIRRTDF